MANILLAEKGFNRR
ncbi:hypothetical protein VTN00DRAFT_2467 [Thermoascus crustaceus]